MREAGVSHFGGQTMKSQLFISIMLIMLTSVVVNAQTRKDNIVSNASKAAWIDVTAPLDMATSPTYPGDTRPHFELQKSFEKGDQVTLSSYLMTAHAGTHVDAPLHFVANID
jgi:hypothetical protein